jgi:hypothetical protein
MPAESKAQRKAMAIAEHDPGALYPENKGLAEMSKGQLHDFAVTKEKGLPEHKKPKHKKHGGGGAGMRGAGRQPKPRGGSFY